MPSIQKQPSGILPSGEANFYDFSQISPIGAQYPHPETFFSDGSGLIYTSGSMPTSGIIERISVISHSGLVNIFSNVSSVSGLISPDFELGNDYIHYYPNPNTVNNKDYSRNRNYNIPFVSSYKETVTLYDPYGRIIL